MYLQALKPTRMAFSYSLPSTQLVTRNF